MTVACYGPIVRATERVGKKGRERGRDRQKQQKKLKQFSTLARGVGVATDREREEGECNQCNLDKLGHRQQLRGKCLI